MEVYYRELISDEASLEGLVDDLMLVVQGAGELAEVAAVDLEQEQRQELTGRLQRLQKVARRIKQHALDGAQATDRVVRRHPYSALGFGFGAGVLLGVVLSRMLAADGEAGDAPANSPG